MAIGTWQSFNSIPAPECKNALHPDAYNKWMQASDDAKNVTEPAATDISGLQNAFDEYIAIVDNATAIAEIARDTDAPQAIYDLQGRRVNAVQKGIYIINGKKVVR